MALSLVNRCKQVIEQPKSSKTAIRLTNKVTRANRWQRHFSSLLSEMAFTGLNTTGGRANGVMPWLLMVTGMLYC